MDFAALEQEYRRFLVLEDDPDIIKVIYACVLANKLDGDPVWTIITGPSASGKTELLLSMRDAKYICAVSQITPKSLLPAYGDPRETSLLWRANHKVLVIEDMSATNSQYREARSELMGDLRLVHSGEFERTTGKGKIRWKGRIGMIAGSTMPPGQETVQDNQLGERFLYFRCGVQSSRELLMRVQSFADNKSGGRTKIREAAAAFLDSFEVPKDRLLMPRSIKELVMSVAELLVVCRCAVVRGSYSREIERPAEVRELPTRVISQLTCVCKLLYHLGADKPQMKRILFRFLLSSMPDVRAKVLTAIIHEARTKVEIAKWPPFMSQTPSDRVVEDMEALSILFRDEDGSYFVKNDLLREGVIATLVKS